MSEEKPNEENSEVLEDSAAAVSEESSEEVTKVDSVSLEDQLDKAKKDYLYLYADFENFRKKALQERSMLAKYANENILRDLLQIMDNFNLAIAIDVNSDNLKSYVDGVNMIARELDNMMERFGVQKIASSKTFDPNLHEAIATEETTEKKAGEILKVFKEGYKLHDRLLRPAQVVIASEKSKD